MAVAFKPLDNLMQAVAKTMGQHGDSQLAFINPREAKILKNAGGVGKPHPLLPSVLQYYNEGAGGDDSGNSGGSAAGATGGEHSNTNTGEGTQDSTSQSIDVAGEDVYGHTPTVEQQDPTATQQALGPLAGMLVGAISSLIEDATGITAAKEDVKGSIKEALSGMFSQDTSGTGGRNIGSSGETVSAGSKDPGPSGGGIGGKGGGADIIDPNNPNSIANTSTALANDTAKDKPTSPFSGMAPWEVYQQGLLKQQQFRTSGSNSVFFNNPPSLWPQDPLKPTGTTTQLPGTIPIHVDDVANPLVAILKGQVRQDQAT